MVFISMMLETSLGKTSFHMESADQEQYYEFSPACPGRKAW